MRFIKIGLFLLLSVVLSGCSLVGDRSQSLSGGDQINQDKLAQEQGLNEEIKVTTALVKKFYPQESNLDKQPEAGAGVEPVTFVIDQELEVKFYLIDKYNPGICYGMPAPVPQASIDSLLSGNVELVAVIRYRYDLTGDMDVYNKLKKLNGIELTKLSGGQYQYQFIDGQCCTQVHYGGQIEIIGQTISDTVISQDYVISPC